MSGEGQPTQEAFVAKGGSDGQVMVISPNGRVEFMGVWEYVRFAWSVIRSGRKIEVRDE